MRPLINRPRTAFWTILLVIALGAATACQRTAREGAEQRLATVGSQTLTISEAVEAIPPHILGRDSLGALDAYRQDWIRKQLILQEAERLGISQNATIRRRLERQRNDILTQGLKDHVMAEYNEDLVVTDEEARNYYQAHKDQLVLDERYVRFRHLVARTYTDAQSARRALMRGIEWPEVARQYSLNAEARLQESEKFWPISMALSEYQQMNTLLQRIGITEISPIQRIGGDYHFVQLMETRPQGGHPDLDWLIEQIKEWLILEKRRRHFNSYVKNLYLNAQSNNEINTFNVLTPNRNTEPSEPDTVGSLQSND